MDQDVSDKFTAAESRMAALDARIAAAEVRVTAVETGAVKDREVVAGLVKDVAQLTADQKIQLEILKRLDAVAANPHFKIILAIVATALGSWAASKGLK